MPETRLLLLAGGSALAGIGLFLWLRSKQIASPTSLPTPASPAATPSTTAGAAKDDDDGGLAGCISTEGGGFFDEELPEGRICPWVETSADDVRRFVGLARITKDDVLFDLGCGTGTIQCIASDMVGCRGIGVDIDPLRIEEAQERARDMGKQVEALNTFETVDFVGAPPDTSAASVIVLYLLPENLLSLRDMLAEKLKGRDAATAGANARAKGGAAAEAAAGTPLRIATFDYPIPGWTPVAEDRPEGGTGLYVYDRTSHHLWAEDWAMQMAHSS
jgi:SAM-dependent methyltransferase